MTLEELIAQQHEEQAYSVRQGKEFVIEPTEQRRQREENGG